MSFLIGGREMRREENKEEREEALWEETGDKSTGPGETVSVWGTPLGRNTPPPPSQPASQPAFRKEDWEL